MGTTVSVLHVDDDGALLDIAATFLERADARIQVTTETDPTAVPGHLRDGEYDCVVSDYNMPEMDGLDLLRRLQRTHPDLPFVLFTGTDDASVGVEALEVGATDFCRKQVGTDHYRVLAARIVDTVERQREHERLRAEIDSLRETVRRTGDELARLVAEEGGDGDGAGVVTLRTADHERLRELAAELSRATDDAGGPPDG